IGSDGDDIIDGGKGIDKITPGGGADTIVYEFGSDSSSFSGHDGTNVVKGFNRGVDKLRFVTQDNSGDYATAEKFWATSLIADTPMFLPQVLFHLAENEGTGGYDVVVTGVAFTFRQTGVFSGGRIAGGYLHIEFAEDEWMSDVDFIASIGGIQNYDSSLKTITSLNGLEAYLGGAGSVEYVASNMVITPTITNIDEGEVGVGGLNIATISVINDDELTFSIDNDNFELDGTVLRLKQGVDLAFNDHSGGVITVTVKASKPGSVGLSKTYSLVINDTNNAPIFAAGLAGEITPDAPDQDSPAPYRAAKGTRAPDVSTVSGVIAITDVDVIANFRTITLAPQSDRDGQYGSITFNGNTWVYTLDSSLYTVKQLGIGEVLTDSFEVGVAGVATTAIITVTINGANDRPTIRVFAPLGNVDENADASEISGIKFIANDIDTADQDIINDINLGNASNFIVMDEDGVVSTLFEAYLISGQGINSIFGIKLKDGVSLDFEAAPIHRIQVAYDDQSGADNAQSTPRIITINVNNHNDTPPVFTSDGIGAAILENTEITDNTSVYTAVAIADAGASITYTLEGGDAALFNIDSDGVVTFADATTPNFEGKSSYSFSVKATALAPNSLPQTAIHDVTIAVTDANDAPSAMTIIGNVLAPNRTHIGIIAAIDADDAAKTTFTYSLTGDGVDDGLFSIDGASGVLSFIGDDTSRKTNGHYAIEVMVQDSHSNEDGTITTQTLTQQFNIIAGGIFVSNTDGRKVFSNDLVGVFDEHSTPTTPSIIGTLGFEGADDATFTLADGNTEFTISAGGILSYIGGTVGDYEAAQRGAKTVTILVDIDGAGSEVAAEYQYVITLTDTDDAPTFTDGLAGAVNVADRTAFGTIIIKDVDAISAFKTTTLTQQSSRDGNYGAIVFSGNDWTYTLLDSSLAIIQALDIGEALTDSFEVGVVGSAETADITITINGVNDRPVVDVTAAIGRVDENTMTAPPAPAYGIRFTVDDIDNTDEAAIAASNFVVRDDTGAISTLFEAYVLGGLGARTGADTLFGLRLIEGQILDHDNGDVSHELTIAYDDQSGADNAVSEAHGITVNVNDLLDEPPVFTSTGVGTAIDNTQYETDTPIYTAAAISDTGTGVFYRLLGRDADLFDIDGDGAVTFKTATTPDFEAGDHHYEFTVRASSFGPTATQDVVISVTDANEAPTALTLFGNAVAPKRTDVGVFSAVDIDDPAKTTFTYALTDSGADNALFNIDAATGTLTFMGGEARARKNKGIYNIEAMVTDSHEDGTVHTLTEQFEIIAGGIYVKQYVSAPFRNVFSNDPEPVISEETSGTVTIGKLGFKGFGRATFKIKDEPNYEITTDAEGHQYLRYLGRHPRDHESANNGAEVITFMVDLDGNENQYAPTAYDYIMNVDNIDDNDPEFDQSTGVSGIIKEDAAAIASGTIVIIDADGLGASGQNDVIRTPYGGELIGLYGNIAYTGNDWIYTLNDPNQLEIQRLTVGEMLTDVFSVTLRYFPSTGGGIQVLTQDITITIVGANDRPSFMALRNIGSIDENAVGVNIGTISFWIADIDTRDTATTSAANFIITDEMGAVSTLFEAYNSQIDYVGGSNVFFGIKLKNGASLDHEVAASHRLNILYDDQSGTDNARSIAHTFIINVNDLNDEAPVFTSSSEGTALVENTVITAATTIYTATAISDNGAYISYILSGNTARFFDITSDGRVTFKEATTPDFEQTPSYSLTIWAMAGTQLSSLAVTINVENINDQARLVLIGNALAEGRSNIGTASILDIPTETTRGFSLSGNGTDDHLFSIDTNTGALTFIGSDGDRKVGGSSYSIEISATFIDEGGREIPLTETFEVIAGGIFIQQSDGRKIYSNHLMGIVDEDSTPSIIGTLGFEGADDATFALRLSEAPPQFTISNGGVLSYIGGTIGDYESAGQGAITITILVDIDGAGNGAATEHEYIITLSDVDDAPTFTDGLAGMIDAGTDDDTASAAIVIEDVDVIADFSTTTLAPQSDRDGRYGTISFNGNTWVYTLDNSLYAVKQLGVGAVLTDSFEVGVLGTQAVDTITITINGANDQPTIRVYQPVANADEHKIAANIDGIRFAVNDIDTADADTIAGATTGAGFKIKDASDTISTLFEVYFISDTVFGIRLKDGVELDFEVAASHHLSLTYDDQSAAANAISNPRTLTINVNNLDEPTFNIPTDVISGTAGANTLAGRSNGELIQGGAGNDNITSSGGDDVIIGGYGADTIHLGAGADTVIYRFESDTDDDGAWTASDGGDIIHNFDHGVDRLILVDMSSDGNPIGSAAELIADVDRPIVNIQYSNDGFSHIISLSLTFNEHARNGGQPSGKILSIEFDEAIILSNTELEHFKNSQLVNYDFLQDLLGGGDRFAVIDAETLPEGLNIL
ncbi:MAG: VCBS domain-containing protein, partial [Candidatus Puniceispirillales bacterium WSBS_2018_MAG_OTU23]